MSNRRLHALAALAVTGFVAAGMVGSEEVAAEPPSIEQVAMNEVQVVATHNSYHRELSGAERESQLVLDPGADPNLFYSHSTLVDQFEEQAVRSVELDVQADPQGGLYRHPLVRKRIGLPPLENPEWSEPGTKVFHIVDADYATTCIKLTSCLTQIKSWSDANQGHVPIVIMLEFKSSEARFENQGGVVSPRWDEARFTELEAEIRSLFGEDEMITPDDLRVPGLTLEESVLRDGWPSLREAAGQVMFAMDNTNAVRTAYLSGHPSLEGRLLFTDSAPGTPSSAFMKRNDPRGTNTAAIADLVRRGYFVRTRSDVPMSTVLRGDQEMRTNALASGAQLVSTDFPVAGMATRWNSDFFVSLPGDAAVRCNPANAPVTCPQATLER